MYKVEKKPAYEILILGLGNPLLSDDGIGVLVAEELKKLDCHPQLQILTVETSICYYIREISQARRVIAIDAVQAGGNPGSVYRLDIEDIMHLFEQNAHDMSLPGIVSLAKSITGLPETITIYGVEPEKLDFGAELTLAVKSAIPKIISVLKKEIQKHCRGIK